MLKKIKKLLSDLEACELELEPLERLEPLPLERLEPLPLEQEPLPLVEQEPVEPLPHHDHSTAPQEHQEQAL